LTPRSGVSLAAALAGALLVAACADRAPLRPCPPVSVLKDTERAVMFRDGPGRDITDVRWEVAIASVDSKCTYRGDQLTSQVAVDIVAGRGPAADAPAGVFAFFVAVVDREQNILAKQVFETRVEFAATQGRAGVREEIDQMVRLPAGAEGDDYVVLVGLQLEPQQLEYNRAQRRR